MLIYNQDARSKDYRHIAQSYRPSHADFTYHAKYGRRDYRGGGRSSARETAARVAGGAVAKLLLALAKGKKKHDKRETIRRREEQRDLQRAMRKYK